MSEIYVVSLPQRTGRRQEMERLRKYLGLRWAYFPATPNDSSVIHAIMQRVKILREECEKNGTNCNFAWPGDLNSSALSMKSLHLWSSDFLTPASLQLLAETWLSNPVHPLTCVTKNFHIPKYDPKLPLNRLLTPARVACWHSHLSVIQLISNEEGLDPWSSVLVLEDDVDMESDIKSQLRNLWPLLPPDWDIVFLGHCWSDESKSKPLTGPNQEPWNSSRSMLYPSRSPKCTHAYALTRMGARRLLLHLQYTPFAYSRAIDQAIAWLIESGRLKGYSVVPSIVAQRKIVQSDVMPGKGSKWKDHLTNGILDKAT
ncbi:hypothetical protein F5887DRAFT_1061804 [Amanita rubescens]|nr:hypothetical protein F5887DRAFT_1061804 [Amanita rubescens]